MSTVIDVSGKLGEYMLKGWVLTDKICKKCSKVPLMRSLTDSTSYFCANCDDGPRQSNAAGSSQHSSASSVDSISHVSTTSTPLTEVSSSLSSPTFEPPVDTEDIMRRRQQSDMASTEIGKRLLKGWAMLADECPNNQCYGIPLVRPPKSGPEKDPRKECVVCHNVYVDQVDSNGFQHLVPLSAVSTGHVPAPSGQDPIASSSVDKGKAVQHTAEDDDILNTLASASKEVRNASSTTLHETIAPQTAYTNDLSKDLTNAAAALQTSLRRLTDRLNSVSSGSIVDVDAISHTADAIGKVSQALVQLQQLQKASGP